MTDLVYWVADLLYWAREFCHLAVIVSPAATTTGVSIAVAVAVELTADLLLGPA